MVSCLKEQRHYLEDNPNRLDDIFYTNHQNLESFMTPKKLAQQQAQCVETLGCFDLAIKLIQDQQSTNLILCCNNYTFPRQKRTSSYLAN